jgi:tRNA-splicing ligase RtcB
MNAGSLNYRVIEHTADLGILVAGADINDSFVNAGDMGTHSFILAGSPQVLKETFGSTCHGAGRVLSRKQAIKVGRGRAINRELEDKGIYVQSRGKTTLKEEIPEAYKDISLVVEAVHMAGLAKRVARLRPLGVIKG